MTSSNTHIPKSIQVWMCPECSVWSKHPGDADHEHWCPVPAIPDLLPRRYVLPEFTDEMVERAAQALLDEERGAQGLSIEPLSRVTGAGYYRKTAWIALSAAFSTNRVEGVDDAPR